MHNGLKMKWLRCIFTAKIKSSFFHIDFAIYSYLTVEFLTFSKAKLTVFFNISVPSLFMFSVLKFRDGFNKHLLNSFVWIFLLEKFCFLIILQDRIKKNCPCWVGNDIVTVGFKRVSCHFYNDKASKNFWESTVFS